MAYPNRISVGPDPFEAAQQGPGAIDALHIRTQGVGMAGFHIGQRFTERVALFRGLDPDRTAIPLGTRLLEVLSIDQMAHIVGDVGANVVAPVDQFAD